MMKMQIAIAFAIGCGGGSKPAVQEPKPAVETVQKPPAPDCAAVATKLAAVLAQEDATMPEATVKARGAAVQKRCEADQWTAEARECFGTADTEVDAKGCAKLLTEAQMTAVGKDVEAAGPSPTPAAAASPPPAPKAEEPVRRSRGGTPKKQVPKSSDPCMGGE